MAYKFFLSKGRAGTEKILIAVLTEHGYKEMAEDFLNCGNRQLEKAARSWAKKNSTELSEKNNGPKWGK
jgi:hypothetical protein